MALFDSLKDTLNKSVAAVSVKSESLVESSRVKAAISNAQKKLEAEKNDLGARFYQSWKDGAATLDLFAGDLARMKGIEDEIAGLNARLVQIKEEEDKLLGGAVKSAASPPAPTASGCVFCTKCGKALPAGSRFCDECGTPVT